MATRTIDVIKHAQWTRDTVQQVTPPPAARRLSTLTRTDYQDAFGI